MGTSQPHQRAIQPSVPQEEPLNTVICLALPRHRLPADIAPTKTFGPVDQADGFIGTALDLAEGLGGGWDIEQKASVSMQIS
jgi:hypothetical protein